MSSISVKQDFAFFRHLCLQKESWKPHFPVSLPSYFHLHRLSSSSAEEGQAEGFRPIRSCWRTDRHSRIPDVSSLIKWRFIKVLPLCEWCHNAVVTLTSHTLHVCVSSQQLARLCLCPAPHHGADAWRKITDTLWRSSKWHESWLLFIFLHCSSCCVYPWVWLSVTIPISQIGQFQFVFGAWIASVCHSVLCLSMGALWGGCDDASGPVLVRVMTNGFRMLQSPPLGGAIPSAVFPEEADTLEYRETAEW